jgi:ABC-type sugar transport system permease subunit
MNKAIGNKVAPKKNKKPASLDAKKARAGWIFVLPFILGFVLIYLPIIINSIRFSFSEFNTEDEMDYVADRVKFAVTKFRKLGSFR